jgi:DNA-binding FadR family transcriptional regulator
MDLSDSRTAGQAVPRRVSAMDAVLADLRGRIERGDLEVGEKLPAEAALAAHFGVSRSVVREALRGLQAMGLTVSKTGRGTFVAARVDTQTPVFGGYSARDLTEVRRHVEIPVCAYAARRGDDEDMAALRSLIERMEAETDDAEWVALDTQFHLAIAKASGNEVFRRVTEEIRDALARQSTFLNQLGGRRERSNAEHRLIVDAIMDRAEDAAADAMRAHLDQVELSLSSLVGQDEAEQDKPGRSDG